MTGIIHKLFGVQKPTKSDASDERDEDAVESSGVRFQVPDGDEEVELPQLITGCAQSVGRQRDHNEDALFTLTTNLASNQTRLPIGLYIVADGMGGHKQGEIASGLAVRTLGTQIINKVFLTLINPKPIPPTDSIQEIMFAGMQDAHRNIIKEAPGSGTTLTAALIVGQQMTIAHVGDSRIYHVTEDGKIQALTRDHSLVMRMIELGQLTAEEAAIHPQRNVLYRALGQGEPFEPDIDSYPLPATGYLLLCSDGLWGVVAEEEIAQLVANTTNLQQTCQLLIDAANESGGPDNITAILVHLPGLQN